MLENFDEFSATLLTREEQLGEVMDAFATASGVLADERAEIEGLVNGLANVSRDGLDLIAEHSARLETDIATLTRLGRSVGTQLDAVEDLLDAGPILTAGLNEAYNPQFHAINLRNSFSPVAQQALDPLFDELGVELPSVCVPADVECTPQPGQVSGQSAGPVTPVDDIAGLLGSRRGAGSTTDQGDGDQGDGDQDDDASAPAPSVAERIADGAASAGRFLKGAGRGLMGIVS
jgi:hypothetical protein